MKKIFLSFSLVLLLVINSASIVFAAPGTRDTSFVTGSGFIKASTNFTTQTAAAQSDGKIIVVGNYTKYNGALAENGIVRLNTDGTLDTSFNPGDKLYLGVRYFPATVIVLPNDKLIIAGAFAEYDGEEIGSIIKLNADGTLDETFNIPAEFDEDIFAVAMQSDGKIILGGDFEEYDGAAVRNIVRLTADGEVDGSFVTGNGFTEGGLFGNTQSVQSLAVQVDGSILVGGQFTKYDGVSVAQNFARLDTNGALDTAFNTTLGTGFNLGVSSIKVQSTGEILVGGIFSTLNGGQANAVVRLLADGQVDGSFNSGAGFAGGDTEVRGFIITGTGKILAYGFFTQYNSQEANHIVLLNADGSRDSSFLGTGSNAQLFGVGSVGNAFFLVGFISQYNNTPVGQIAKIGMDGVLDTAFNNGGTGFEEVSGAGIDTVEIQSDGKVLVAGDFTKYNGQDVDQIVRLNTNGSLDTSFTISGYGFDGTIYEMVSQNDGKILVGGDFSSYDSEGSAGLVRLNADGTLDESFALTGDGIDGRAEVVRILSNGQILIGGDFSSYDGVGVGSIALLNADGTRDTSFNSGGDGFDDQIRDIEFQSDGKIVVVGLFTEYNGVTATNIVRLNADGTHDTSFVANGGFNLDFGESLNLAIQSDDKIIVGGNFTEYDGNSAGSIVRFLPLDGSVDTTFNVGGSGFDSYVFRVTAQADDKVVAIGIFDEFNGQARDSIARLNADGTLDSTFDIEELYPDYAGVDDARVQSDGKMVLVGSFEKYGGASVNGIVRLMGSYSAPDPEPEPEPEPPRTRVVGGSSSAVRPVITTPTPSTDTTDCKAGDMFSATTGARCVSTSPTTPTTPTTPSSTTFTKVLNQGMTDPQVKLLQIYLNTHGAPVALTGAGSPGKETTFFGPATKAALIKFQELNAKDILTPLGLTKGTGTLAAKTIAFMLANK